MNVFLTDELDHRFYFFPNDQTCDATPRSCPLRMRKIYGIIYHISKIYTWTQNQCDVSYCRTCSRAWLFKGYDVKMLIRENDTFERERAIFSIFTRWNNTYGSKPPPPNVTRSPKILFCWMLCNVKWMWEKKIKYHASARLPILSYCSRKIRFYCCGLPISIVLLKGTSCVGFDNILFETYIIIRAMYK